MSTTKSTLNLLLIVAVSSFAVVAPASVNRHRHGRRESVDDACSVTLHRSLCVRTLAPFSIPAGPRSIQCWTKAAVSATLAETARVLRYVDKLRSDATQVKGRRARDALSVCAECLDNARRQLRQSVAELRRLSHGGSFRSSMNNVETWVSAALTNQDTCAEELAGWKSQLAAAIGGRVVKTTYYSSNALALLNKMAADGGN